MQAYQFEQYVSPSHRVSVELPENAPTGSAKIIVLFPNPSGVGIDLAVPGAANATPPSQGMSEQGVRDLNALFTYLDQLPPGKRSVEEIDRDIADERASWD